VKPKAKRSDRPKIKPPRLTAPQTRGLFGGLYAAALIFEFAVRVKGRSAARRLCEDRIILVEAENAQAALKEATRQGRESRHRYRNSAGNPVHFRLVGVADLIHLGVECDANEVWYRLRERVRPWERRKALILPAEKLTAIRNERELIGPIECV